MSTRARTMELLKVGSAETAKLLGATACAALFFAPHGVNHTLETATVETTVVGFPTEAGFYPNGSRLSILNQANIYAEDTTQQGTNIGLSAEVTGLPRFENIGQVTDFFSPERIRVYTSLADSPEAAAESYKTALAQEATDTMIDYELRHAIPTGLALYGGLTVLRLRRKIASLENTPPQYHRTWRSIAGTAAIAVAISGATADIDYDQWEEDNAIPDNLSTLTALDGTSLEGTKIDNPGIAKAANLGIRYGIRLKDRRAEERNAFLESTVPVLEAQLQTLSPPEDDEELLVYVSDIHASKAGVQLATTMVSTLQNRFGTDKVRVVYNLGDMLYDPRIQASAVADQADIITEGSEVLAPGNHDIDNTVELAREEGIVVPNGHETVEGVEVYSVADPEQTPFLQNSYSPDPSITQESIGQAAYRAIEENPVDVVNFHDPAAVGAMVGTASRSELTAEGDLLTCEGNDDYHDVAADILSAGHSHKQYPINMECNSDGTWFVVNLQGTGGGAEESPTLNNWSDPDGVPIKTVSYRVFYRNTTFDSVTGYADVAIEPDTNVLPIVRTNIGTLDGAPFAISEATGNTASSKLKVKQSNQKSN